MPGIYRSIAQRNGEGRCALKHIELSGLLSDFGDHLNARGARADYRDQFTREGGLFCWPAAGEVLLAGEVIQPFEARFDGCRDKARRHDAKSCRYALAGIRFNLPALGALIKMGGGDAGVKLNVAS